MQTKEKILLFWSGGKNSALALHDLQNNPTYEVVGLVTTLDREKNRVRYHGIPDNSILEQAKLLKLPLQRIFLPENASIEEYVKQVSSILSMYAKRGITKVAFGDVNIESDKKFKESFLKELGMSALFPLWAQETTELAKRFFSSGHKALVTAVQASKLGYDFLACEYNESYIERLPKEIDPFGEQGEFHTFVTYGPAFKMRVGFSKSIAVEEDGFLVSLIKEP